MAIVKARKKQSKRPVQRERREQGRLVSWFKVQYPHIKIAASANGGRRSAREAMYMKREGVLSGVPDLQIFKACRGFHGMFIEMKAPATSTSAKGRLSAEQKDMLAYLNNENYLAIACWGYNEAREQIEWYLAGH